MFHLQGQKVQDSLEEDGIEQRAQLHQEKNPFPKRDAEDRNDALDVLYPSTVSLQLFFSVILGDTGSENTGHFLLTDTSLKM